MNTFHKYVPNVFLAKCDAPHEKGEIIELQTRHGKAVEVEVWNLIDSATDRNIYLYSFTRLDGFNRQEWAQRRAERLAGWATSAESRGQERRKAADKHRDFLSLGEPIKVGHHSERRHRRIIEDAQKNFGKYIQEYEKAERLKDRAEYWKAKASEINLSMPDSIEYYQTVLEDAKERHQHLKNNPQSREHSMALAYANKAVKEAEKNLALAIKLWGE